jgi:hypothetical protein
MLTLDIHHIEYLAEGGPDSSENLIALCPNCHTRHHHGHIPLDSIRAWKMVLLSLNEGFDRQSINTLLALSELRGSLEVSGDGLLTCAGLVASGLVRVTPSHRAVINNPTTVYAISLSEKGLMVIEGWKRGDQRAVIAAGQDESNTKSY